MRRWLFLMLLVGCGHVPLDQAITAHNVFRQTLLTASDEYTPLYTQAAAANMGKPEADYQDAMKPYNAAASAMQSARVVVDTLNSVLAQCIAENDDSCDEARIGFACAAAALDSLSSSYGQIRGGAPLYAATAIAKAQLAELAHGVDCNAR